MPLIITPQKRHCLQASADAQQCLPAVTSNAAMHGLSAARIGLPCVHKPDAAVSGDGGGGVLCLRSAYV